MPHADKYAAFLFQFFLLGQLSFVRMLDIINLTSRAPDKIRMNRPGKPPRLDSILTPSIPVVPVMTIETDPMRAPLNIFILFSALKRDSAIAEFFKKSPERESVLESIAVTNEINKVIKKIEPTIENAGSELSKA